jgi:chorismate mutase
MSTIKERIALLNAKKPAADEPSVTVNNPVASPAQNKTAESVTPTGAVKRTSIVAERLANMKNGNSSPAGNNLADAASTPVKVTERPTSIKSTPPPLPAPSAASPIIKDTNSSTQESNPADLTTPPVKRMSIADRIAAMKSSTPNEQPPAPKSPAVNTTTTTNEPTPVKQISVADKIAAMKAKPSPEKVVDEKPQEANANTASPMKRMSIADKIAAMKSKAEPEKVEEKPKPPSAKATSIAEKIAAMQAASAAASPPPPPAPLSAGHSSPPPPPPSRLAATNTTEDDSHTHHDNNNNTNNTGSHANHSGTPSKAEGGIGPSPTTKRLSVDKIKFAGAINLGGLNPMAPRPMFIKPKPVEEEEAGGAGADHDKVTHSSVGENGELQHVSFLLFFLTFHL